MALPSSGSLYFSAIYTELTGSNPETLTLMSKLFNGDYATINPNSPSQPSANQPYSLGSFHGYDQNASGGGVAIQISEFGFEDGRREACEVGPSVDPQTIYWSGPIPLPIGPGPILYSDSSLTTPFDGHEQWFYVYANNSSYQISVEGYLMNIIPCG